MITKEEKRRQMLENPVEKLVCTMAVPTIITMMITALYNMADTYFVGQLDTISTAAVGLALPLMNVVQALGFFFGHGSGNYMSAKLGAGDSKAADTMGDTAAVLSLISGGIIAAAGLLFIHPMCILLGATELLMEKTTEYISVLLIGVPFMMSSFTMNNQLRFQGSAFLGMIGMGVGSVLNVGLDPLFIYVFDMGVKGAALATVVSQIISFMILLKMGGRLPLRKPFFKLTGAIALSILKFGTPSLARQGIMSVAAIYLNNAAGAYSEAVIAAVSVVNRIVMLGASVIIGLGQGFQPVCGFNSGAERYDRVKKSYLFCLRLSTGFMAVFGLLSFIFAPSLVAFFRDDPEVIAAGTPLLRYQCITSVFQGMIVMTNMILQNMGKTVRASILAVARQGLFFIPLLHILTKYWGLHGLTLTQSAADLLTAIVTAPMMIIMLRELDKACSRSSSLC
ncbi:MAG: MATE family efflux transporter [Oscillospiraceae bacterium]|nr:MATE family efflux transporter [Oscillospiraceae bacterium]